MNTFEDLSWDNVESFVTKYTNQQPAVFWNLEASASLQIERDLSRRNLQVLRYAESGSLEIGFEEVETIFSDELISTLLGKEQRQVSPNHESGLSGVRLIIETAVPKDLDAGEYLPVLGTGGRIIAFQQARGLTAEVTVRQRLGAKEGVWRNPEEILSHLRREYSDSGPNLRLRAAYGYFELSKYEFQKLMRPVFVFSLEQPRDKEQDFPAWKTTIVEPATTSLEFTLEAGLGSWID